MTGYELADLAKLTMLLAGMFYALTVATGRRLVNQASCYAPFRLLNPF